VQNASTFLSVAGTVWIIFSNGANNITSKADGGHFIKAGVEGAKLPTIFIVLCLPMRLAAHELN